MGVKYAKADRCCMFCFVNHFVETPNSDIFAYTFQSNEYADSRHLCEASGRRHGGGVCAFPYGLMDSISTKPKHPAPKRPLSCQEWAEVHLGSSYS